MTTAQPGQEQRMDNYSARDMLIRRRKDAESLGGSAEITTEELDEAIAALTRPTAAPTSEVTDAMIEAGIDACQKMKDAMELREMSDKPEDMPDYDEGDVMRSIYTAMHAARPTADLGEDGDLIVRLLEPDSHDPDCPFKDHCYCNDDAPHDNIADDDKRQAADRLILYREALGQIEAGATNGEAEFRRRLGTRKQPTWLSVNALQDYLAASGGTARAVLRSGG